ncbi:cis-aconitate decarboxylase-like isoform X2 [Babylonia areolata]|uniref:cis-aconitate decarboxylase-like isoform X2 n=1 Tax=Babylonia areolata TaxID=304850 RepID=UPI003FD34897
MLRVSETFSRLFQPGHVYNCTAARRKSTTRDSALPTTAPTPANRNYVQAAVQPVNLPASSVTTWVSDLASGTSLSDLSPLTLTRSKRMVLDTLGVGILGYQTDITSTVTRCVHPSHPPPDTTRDTGDNPTSSGSTRRHGQATLWGSSGLTTTPSLAAYINGVSVHSMDFDDTWYPATHPSGPVLPAVLALAESMTGDYRPSLSDLLVAFNVGIQVQGLLLRCSDSAKAIPDRFHPPAVVGVMGSAAACARLLGGGPGTMRHALAIATSFAGAPMANAGTTTKPLHTGKAARLGLEAALLADHGLQGNADILDMPSGFGAFYPDYDPEGFLLAHGHHPDFILHSQDVAIKRFPAHLAMHWTIDAVMALRDKLPRSADLQQSPPIISPENVKVIRIRAPPSKYINRPLPSTPHEARHSFQFNACTALLDGAVTPHSFLHAARRRPQLHALLRKTVMETPDDNLPNFRDMYVEVEVTLKSGQVVAGRCDTPYGHWRRPLSQEHLEAKFLSNSSALPREAQQGLIVTVSAMDTSSNSTASSEDLLHMLKA